MDGVTIPTYRVRDPNALTQVLGWAKYRSASGGVYFRGQTRSYDDMLPSGMRPTAGAHRPQTMMTALKAYTTELVGPCECDPPKRLFSNIHECLERVPPGKVRQPVVASTYRAVIEPLLQHYGVATRWIDVVDNVWVALWFAVHDQVDKGRYSHHSRRSVAAGGSEPQSAYIAVLDAGAQVPSEIPGYSTGETSRVVDLRYSVPSVYLRPHAQHGVLMAAPSGNEETRYSLRDSTVLYLQIDLRDAIDWLGDGAMLGPFVLFPPATVDDGYRDLLGGPEPPECLGHIRIFGPGR